MKRLRRCRPYWTGILLLSGWPCVALPAGAEEHAGATAPDEQESVEPRSASSPSAGGEAVEVTSMGTRPHPSAPPRARGVSGSVITGERLVQPGATTAHVLREAPGVQVTEVGGLGAPATASIRGATAEQTPVYLAGVRINDEVGGAANLSEVPLFLIERAEVYRSHAPLSADTLGVGGAIFFEPRIATEDEVVTGAELGSYGTRGGWVYGSMAEGRRGLLAGFELSAADNDYPFFDDRGTLFSAGDDGTRRLMNADVQMSNGWMHATHPLGRAQLSLLWHHTDREQGAPKLALVPSREARVSHQRDLVALRSVLPVDAWKGALALSTQAVAAETVVDDPSSELGLLTPETRTPGERFEQGVEASQRVEFGRSLPSLRLVEKLGVAVDRLRRMERQSGRLVTALSARRLTSRAAVAAELQLLEAIVFDATTSFSCITTSRGAISVCEAFEPGGRAGVGFRKATYEVFASVGRYRRDPTLSELYGASLLVRGNSQLIPETGTSYELGARWQLASNGQESPLWLDGSLFLRETDDLVTYVRTAQGYLYPRNSDSALARGGELAVGARPASWVEGTSQISLLDARDQSPNRQTTNDVLPFHSRLVSATLVTFTAPLQRGVVDDGGVTFKWVYQSSRYADPAGLGVIPKQSALDLELFLHALDGHGTARARIANVLDSRRFDVVGFPLPGRSAFLSMEASW